MEATTTYDEHAAVGFGGAFTRQLRFLWTSRRPLLLAVALLAVLVLGGEPWTRDPKMRFLAVWPVWLYIVPIFWAFAVLHNEGPSSRFYFWAHPTSRAGHTMARLTAGLVWLWVMYALLIVAGWAYGMADGDAWQMAEIGLAAWVNYFTGPLLIYLLVSILTVPSDYPIRWFFGLLFAIPLLISALDSWIEDAEKLLGTVFKPLINEDWGFLITTGGAMVREIEKLDVTIRSMMDPTYSGTASFDMANDWWLATPLWIVVMVGIVAFIATRHPDTLPKVRSLKFWT